VNRAIFLDRDGTLIEDKGYAYKVADLKLFPEVVEGLSLLKEDYIFFIITNQPGIGMGLFKVEDFEAYNNSLINLLKEHGINIERTYFCPHIGGCDCRKPSTKYIEEIARDFQVSIKESWVIGDHPSDIIMAINAGCHSVYLLTGHGEKHLLELESKGIRPTFIAPDFLSAARCIKGI